MHGIMAYGTCVLIHMVGPEAKEWGVPFERAIVHHDEDSLTMAVAATIDYLADIDRSTVDGLCLASTTW